MEKHFKTIIVSDVHLGTNGSKAKEIGNFLKNYTCDRLILNGDIIDGWQLKKYGRWKKQHTKFFKRILQLIERCNTEVIYLRGNHDDFLDQIIPIRFGNIKVQRDYILHSGIKKYYVVHGDVFDSITSKLKWIAKLGDIGYTFLLWINHRYNNYRIKRGLPYYSLSQVVKQKVKTAVSYISDFEKQISILARIKKCDGIICGHIHQPAIKILDGVVYMNSGDWVETLSALVEDYDGKWEILYYSVHKEEMEEEEEEDLEKSKDLLLLQAELRLQKKGN